jgi:hypothetical protein
MNTLLEKLEIKTNNTETLNGALTNKSTLSNVLDFFGLGASMRNSSENDIIKIFSKAFSENPLLALKCLFYHRDVRFGQGERRVFRIICKWLGNEYPEILSKNLHIIPEFGRWDDLFVLENTKVWNQVLDMVNNEFNQMLQQNTRSLACKWFPSINTSSKETRRLAKVICKYLGITEKRYRQTLSRTREYIKVVERDMCSKNWKDIEYSKVPSKASLKYKDAFLKHDKERYTQFIADVKSGKTKINASVTYPYEIVEKILYDGDNSETLDVIWNALPNYMDGNKHNGIVVADVSASMSGRPMAVSISLAMYFSERVKGAFANSFITFSQNPALQKVVGNNIREKVVNLSNADWSMNTDLQAVFDLILKTAIENNIPQEEMPDAIYIVSDMQFDVACNDNGKTNFDEIKSKYEQAGYKQPNLIFWNVNAYTNQTPITKNDKGTCLVSGCSPVILKTLLSGKEINPIDIMLEILNKTRYNSIIS